MTEVKAKKPFGLESSNWTGEVQPKAIKMMQAAQEHGVKRIRWSFPEGVTPEVKIALEAMSKDGITVVVDGPVINVGGN